MIARHTVRGRRELAQTATCDVVLTLITFAVLVARLRTNNTYDICVLLAHIFAHTFTCIIQLIVLKYTIVTSDPLHLQRVFYVVAALIDLGALVCFLFLYALHDHRGTIDAPYVALRVTIGIAFVVVDACGWLYADLSYQFIDTLVYADNGSRMYATVQYAVSARNYTENAATGRINSVHLAAPAKAPAARTMNDYDSV